MQRNLEFEFRTFLSKVSCEATLALSRLSVDGGLRAELALERMARWCREVPPFDTTTVTPEMEQK